MNNLKEIYGHIREKEKATEEELLSELSDNEKSFILKDFVYLARELNSTIVFPEEMNWSLFVRNFVKDIVMDKIEFFKQESSLIEEDDLPF